MSNLLYTCCHRLRSSVVTAWQRTMAIRTDIPQAGTCPPQTSTFPPYNLIQGSSVQHESASQTVWLTIGSGRSAVFAQHTDVASTQDCTMCNMYSLVDYCSGECEAAMQPSDRLLWTLAICYVCEVACDERTDRQTDRSGLAVLRCAVLTHDSNVRHWRLFWHEVAINNCMERLVVLASWHCRLTPPSWTVVSIWIGFCHTGCISLCIA